MKKILISVILIILINLNGTIVEYEQFSDELKKGIITDSGSLVLIEEYTATWCQTCSEIDPSIQELAELHNERVALIALHPAEGVDDLGNYASGSRINSLFNGSVVQAPSFVIDRTSYIEGAPEISALNSLILQSQSKKSNFSEIKFSVLKKENKLNFEIILDKNSVGVVNLMILENKLTSNNYVGDLDKFDNVLKEMISFNISSKEILTSEENAQYNISSLNENLKINLTYNLNGDMNANNLGFIVTHEVVEDNIYEIKGVAKIIQGELNVNDDSNVLLILGIFFILGVFASLGFLDTTARNEEE